MICNYTYSPIIEDYQKDGKLNVAAILKALENSGNLHSDSAGDNILAGSNNNKAWVLTDWRIQIDKYPSYGNKIDVQTWAEDGKVILSTNRGFLMTSNNEVLVRGLSKWVLLDLQTNRPIKIDEELINKYNPDSKRSFEDSKFSKIDSPSTFESEKIIQLRRSDIDFNGHVHNLCYLDYALDALPVDIYKNLSIKNIRISYKTPIKDGDSVVAKYVFANDKHIVCIFTDNALCASIELS